MRYLGAFACVLAALAVSPQGASAQGGEEDSLSAWQADTASKPASTSEELGPQELRVRRRSGIGLGVSLAAFVGGLAMVGSALSNATYICVFECPPPPDWVAPVGATGGFLTVGGLAGMIVSAVTLGRGQKEPRSLEPTSPDDLTGAKLRQRHRELRNLREAHYGRPHRVQWDLAQSRLVF